MPNSRFCARCGKSLGGSSAKLSKDEFLGLKSKVGKSGVYRSTSEIGIVCVGRGTKLKWRLQPSYKLTLPPCAFLEPSRHTAWLDCGLARECAGQPRACKQCAKKLPLARNLKDFTVVYAGVPCPTDFDDSAGASLVSLKVSRIPWRNSCD